MLVMLLPPCAVRGGGGDSKEKSESKSESEEQRSITCGREVKEVMVVGGIGTAAN